MERDPFRRRFRRWRRSAGVGIHRNWWRHRWTVLALVAVSSVLLGVVGLFRYHRTRDPVPALSLFYESLTLFNLGASDLEGPLPPELEVARFLAPLVVFTAIIGAVLAAWERGSARTRARRMRRHAVVIGLGDRGLTLAEEIHCDGGDVVVIERAEHHPNVSVARHSGIPVLIGDGTDPDVLLAARLDRAETLVALVGAAGDAAGVADAVLAAQRRFDPSGSGRLRSFVHIGDADLVRELQTSVDPERLRYRQEFFDLDDRAAQAIVGTLDELWSPVAEGRAPGPVIVAGLGAIGEGVVLELTRRWDVIRLDSPDSLASLPLRVVALTGPDGPAPDEVVERLRCRHPKIGSATTPAGSRPPACVVEVTTIGDPNPARGVGEALRLAGEPPVALILALPDETLRVRTALAARTALAGASTRIIITAGHRRSLAGLVRSRAGATPSIEVFPVLESVCRLEEIIQGRLAAMARSIHESYRRHLTARDPSNPADVEWARLRADLRQQNIDAAQDTWESLSALGYQIVPLQSEDADAFRFPPEDLDRLAAREHRRWFGVKYPGVTSPPWSKVAPEDQRKTRQQIRELPRVLAFAGLEIRAGSAGGRTCAS